ncbi:hypothetical protein JCM10207_006066 [Rhodosporidiobolus poonsookiae]
MPPIQYGDKKAKEAEEGELKFCAAWRKLPATPPGTVRLFDRSDFYAAYGPDAYFVARTHYKTETVIKPLGAVSEQHPNGLASVTLSHSVAQTFLREALTTRQLRVEIWEAENGAGGGKGTTKWRLGKAASPGNLGAVEDLLFTHTDLLAAPVILALKLQVKDNVKTVGIAFADTSLQDLGVSEYVDTDLFSNTESLLIQLGVKEVLIAAEDKAHEYDLNKLKTLIERCNIVITERKKADFVNKDVEQDLNRLLRSSDLAASARPEFDNPVALGAVHALISYLGLMGDATNFGAYALRTHDLSQYVRLDASALRALNLMPDPTGLGGASKTMSVFGLLNRCKTAQGTRLLAMWLKQPLVNLHAIQQRQDLVECLFEGQEFRAAIADDFLKSMPDFHRLSKRFQKGAANLEDVVRVYQAVLLLPGLVTLLESGVPEQDEEDEGGDVEMEDGEGEGAAMSTGKRWKALVEELWLSKLREHAAQLAAYQSLVETTIDLSELDRHNFVIKAEFDPELQGLMDRLAGVRDGLDTVHQEVADDLGMDPKGKVLHFEQHSLYGYCFRLTRKEATAIKNKKGYIELRNQTSGVLFTTKELKRLVDDHKDVTKEYDKKQSSLVKEVIQIAASYCEVLETLNGVIAHIDVLQSLAASALAAPIPYIKPTVFERGGGSLRLEEARHPCLEVQEGINFIANDVHLERDVSEFGIITGPNAGGKSVFIRQTALLALLAQIGSFVPASVAEVPIFDSVLCRVGAGDSQLKGVSTFMAEMLETSAILRQATRDSLVIIDELGRGTSTYDGFGLAWAISEHLSTVTRASVLFATHFHELTSLANEVAHVKNLHVVAHVEANPNTLTGKDITLLYKVAEGVCDQSFGIHVAELANFPDEVVKLAKRKADDLEDFSEPTAASTAANGAVTSDSTNPAAALAPDQVAEGTALVEAFLEAWAARTASLPLSGEADGEGREARREAEMKELVGCFEEYRERFEGSEWAREVLAKTY